MIGSNLAEKLDTVPVSPVLRTKPVTVADLFCGAGSLSMGAHDAMVELGLAPQFVAVNHWDIATQTYALNHPGADVHCVNLDAAFPSHLVPGGKLDLLLGGIECTFFSRARGGKPMQDQQRMSAWHVVRWCTELRVKRLLLENVPEFCDWGPVGRSTGRPIKRRKGEYFRAWVAALKAIGFDLQWRVVNCADHGDATTRQRLFIQGRSDGKAISWLAPQYSRPGVSGVQSLGTQPWRTARQCIDWSILGKSIFDRKRPLAPKTLMRIAAGIIKFKWPEPFIVVLRQHCDARGIDLPLPAITAGGTHIALAQPIVVNMKGKSSALSSDVPFPTQTAHARHLAIAEPFILSQASGGVARAVEVPVATITTGGRGGAHALIAPYYGSGSGETCTSVDGALPTVTTKARFGLVMPVTHNCSGNRARELDDPLPTITTARRGELAFIAPAREHDILFRMLEPHELAAAMSISEPGRPYQFVGNKTQVVRQIGQAVPRRTAKALVKELMRT